MEILYLPCTYFHISIIPSDFMFYFFGAFSMISKIWRVYYRFIDG